MNATTYLIDNKTNVEQTFFDKVHEILSEARKNGKNVLDFSIGDPDLPPPQGVIDYFVNGLKVKGIFAYSELYGEREFIEMIAKWMQAKHHVSLNPDTEILPLLGSKEGITHLALGVLDKGDYAAYAVPSYPIYRQAIELAGANSVELPLDSHEDYAPDPKMWKFEAGQTPKLIYLNYPHNPTGAVLTKEYAEKIVAYAHSHDTAICMDSVYSTIRFEAHTKHLSILSVPGAKEHCIEMYSFSKDFNLPGIRLGFAVGNKKLIDRLKAIKTNVDVSAFKLLQEVGTRLLQEDIDGKLDRFFQMNNDTYKLRYACIEQILKAHDITYFKGEGTFYLWFQPPFGWTDRGFCDHVYQTESALLVPGSEFSQAGSGWCRIALSKPDEQIYQLAECLDRVFSAGGKPS